MQVLFLIWKVLFVTFHRSNHQCLIMYKKSKIEWKKGKKTHFLRCHHFRGHNENWLILVQTDFRNINIHTTAFITLLICLRKKLRENSKPSHTARSDTILSHIYLLVRLSYINALPINQPRTKLCGREAVRHKLKNRQKMHCYPLHLQVDIGF